MQPGSTDFTLDAELRIILRRKWWLLGLCLAAGVLAFVFSSPPFRQPEFKSTAEIVPPALKEINSIRYDKERFEGFAISDQRDMERVVAALQSEDAMDVMVKQFDLINHYGLADVTDTVAQRKVLIETYQDNVVVGITDYATVHIDVYDKDPVFAAKLANAYIAYADSFLETIARRRVGLAQVNSSLREVETELTQVRDSLAKLRAVYGVYIVNQLSDVASQSLAGKFNTPEFNTRYDKLMSLELRARYLGEYQIALSTEKFYREEMLRTFPMLIKVVNVAKPSPQKARPKRSLMALLAVAMALAFGSVTVVLIEKWRTSKA